jgi:hypothetical protein
MESRIDLPRVPLLKGESNLEEWKDILVEVLRTQALEDHLTDDQPQPEDAAELKTWKKERAMVVLIIKGSLQAVRTLFINNGWDPNNRSPKYHYDFVLRYIPKVSEASLGDLVLELGRINRADFDSMLKYQDRLNWLKKKLTKLKMLVNEEKFWLWIAINGIREHYAQQHAFMVRDMDAGTLTWDKLMEQLSQIHSVEINSAF